MDTSTTVRDQLAYSGLQTILDLDGLTEIAVNKPLEVWFDRGNGWETQAMPNLSLDTCMYLAKSLTVYAGLTLPIGIDNPIASVILPDGERGQIAVPPATQSVVSLTIRKPSKKRFTLDDYEKTGRFSNIEAVRTGQRPLTDLQKKLVQLKQAGKITEFFKTAVPGKMTILLVGGTGSGKTAFMKAMMDHYPLDKRLFTIQDVFELDLPQHKNHLHLFYKKGGVTPKKIIESCMRMKPDHVVLAELRGDEAWTYLEMLNTGHEGSISTIHANCCLSAIVRLTTLIKQSPIGQTLDLAHIDKTIKTSIDIIAYFEHTHLKELYFDPEEKNRLLSE